MNKKTLTVDNTKNKLTPGLEVLIVQKHLRPTQYNTNDYRAYYNLIAQTKVKSFPAGAARPHATWKYKHMLKKMVMPGERIIVEEEFEDREGTDTASIGDISEPFDTDSIRGIDESSDSGILSPDMPSSPAHTRSHGKTKKTKDREHPYYGWKGDGVVYLPGDINGLAEKLQLLVAEFFAGNTTVRDELVHVLDALLRLKQLTRKEYRNVTVRFAASL